MNNIYPQLLQRLDRSLAFRLLVALIAVENMEGFSILVVAMYLIEEHDRAPFHQSLSSLINEHLNE